MQTTLNEIREHVPCTDGWEKLLRYLGKTKADDEPLSILTILESNGLEDAVWCLRAVEGHDKEIRLFAVFCARYYQHLLTHPDSIAVIDIAEQYANGNATKKSLQAAFRASTRDAVWTGHKAARAARAASDSAREFAWNAARSALWEVLNTENELALKAELIRLCRL